MTDTAADAHAYRPWISLAEYRSLPPHDRPPHAVEVAGLGYFDPAAIVRPHVRAALDGRAITTPTLLTDES